MKFIVINGPNINMLGIREKKVYGNEDYNFLEERIKKFAQDNKIDVEIFQSNCEGEIIDILQKCYRDGVDGVVLNAGAYTHYSYAILDAITSIQPIKVVEVHISNIGAREEFRKKSVISEACVGSISGFGIDSYILGLEWLSRKYEK